MHTRTSRCTHIGTRHLRFAVRSLALIALATAACGVDGSAPKRAPHFLSGGDGSPSAGSGGTGATGGATGASSNGGATNGGGTSSPTGATISLEVIAPDVPLLATYQSHNPKMFCRGATCFTNHLEHRSNPSDQRPDVFDVRLQMSTDSGRTWGSMGLFQNIPSRPASLIGDPDGNIYLLMPTDVWAAGAPAWFVKYSPSNGYSAPVVNVTFDKGSAGKFTAVHDAFRRRIYYFTHNNSFSTYEIPNFFVFSEEGQLLSSTALTSAGGTPSQVRGPHYPYLAMSGSTLIAAWTNINQATILQGLPPYESIHAIKSEDGGASWSTLGGYALTTPVLGDLTGPADRITLEDESFQFGLTSHKWLSSLATYQGSLHAFYLTRPSPDRQHYVRYDLAGKTFTANAYPRWGGASTEIHGLDGFFVDGGARLFAVGSDDKTGRLVVLVSSDAGTTWQDHAAVPIGDPGAGAYAITGHKAVLDDGSIVGMFTRIRPNAPNELVRFVVH